MPDMPEEPDAEAAWPPERKARRARMRDLAAEAMADPDFVADLRETMHAFRHVDRETGRRGRKSHKAEPPRLDRANPRLRGQKRAGDPAPTRS